MRRFGRPLALDASFDCAAQTAAPLRTLFSSAKELSHTLILLRDFGVIRDFAFSRRPSKNQAFRSSVRRRYEQYAA
jgi:hypothetical protein